MSNQAHNAGFEAQADSYELIERGQLLAVYVPPSALVPATPALTYPPLAIGILLLIYVLFVETTNFFFVFYVSASKSIESVVNITRKDTGKHRRRAMVARGVDIAGARVLLCVACVFCEKMRLV